MCKKEYKLKDIAEAIGVGYFSLGNLRFADDYPKGSRKGKYIVYTKKEYDDFIRIYHKNHLTKKELSLIESGQLFTQNGAADYLGVMQSVFTRYQRRYKKIPFYVKSAKNIYKKADLDEFKKLGITIKTPKLTDEQKAKAKNRKKIIKENADEFDYPLIKKKEYPPHECEYGPCNNITTNRKLCDTCISDLSGLSGDDAAMIC